MSDIERYTELERIIDFKQRNGADTSKEESELLAMIGEVFEEMEEILENIEDVPSEIDLFIQNELTMNGPIPDIPIAACRHIFPYMEKYARNLIRKFTTPSANLDNVSKEEFRESYEYFDSIFFLFFDAVKKFCGDACEYCYEEFPIESFDKDLKNGLSPYEIVQDALKKLDLVLVYFEPALAEPSKEKCQTLSAVMLIINHDIASSGIFI